MLAFDENTQSMSISSSLALLTSSLQCFASLDSRPFACRHGDTLENRWKVLTSDYRILKKLGNRSGAPEWFHPDTTDDDKWDLLVGYHSDNKSIYKLEDKYCISVSCIAWLASLLCQTRLL